jgi:nitric oxide dioxygenase
MGESIDDRPRRRLRMCWQERERRKGSAAARVLDPMTPDQISLVQRSWEQVRPIAPQAGAIFYGRLFLLDPTLRPLFAADLDDQSRKLTQTLGKVVDCLGDLEAVAPAIAALGRRHAGYGVLDRHYDTVGEALLWTLEQALGSAWSPELAAAWTAAYGTLAGAMRDAAADTTFRNPPTMPTIKHI